MRTRITEIAARLWFDRTPSDLYRLLFLDALVVVAVFLLAGCQTTVVDTSCTAFQIISYSASQDSEATKAQIRGHNAAFRRICP